MNELIIMVFSFGIIASGKWLLALVSEAFEAVG